MRLLRRLTPLFLLLFAALPAAGQSAPAVLAGTVVDAETGDPLPGAHVFIAVSMTGTVTDAEGRFRLDRVPLGAHRLYVSMIGYEPQHRDVMIRRPEVHTFAFQLAPSTVELGEVTVTGEADPHWKERLAKFTRLFIGETPNADETTIVNPEVLDFGEKLGRFTARASEPLVIENRALGYRITYFLKEFVATPTRTMYDGEPLYEVMAPSGPDEAAAWEEKRRAAFMGSFRHFMLAALAGRVEEQGFKTYSRPAERGANVAGTPAPMQGLPGGRRFPVDAAELLKPGETEVERVFEFPGYVEVVFLGETEAPAYLEWRNEPGTRKPKYQTSWLQLEHGPTVVDYKGDVLDPYGVTLMGYYAFERVADELPKEYRPG